MKIATWNVNSILVRLPQALQWIESNNPDVLCIQETKCVDEKFPATAFRELGYQIEVFGQPTYNGVAILSRLPMSNVRRGLHDDQPDAQRRLIAATINSVRIINVYVPNGQAVGTDKYEFKLAWLGRLRTFFDTQCDVKEPLVICGDFNIAPEDRDVHDPALWAGKILCSDAERAALQVVRQWGLIDVFRQHHEEAGFFSWWDYRAGAFRRNHGLRIDHLWATESLAKKSTGAWIDKIQRALEKPSDHAPVLAEFAI
ncbi:MAG: exodeoxyribonuclease III [Acidobacteria bacterium]|nr:exodeoxyribonuclease III [Acidobacteriota bacterium]